MSRLSHLDGRLQILHVVPRLARAFRICATWRIRSGNYEHGTRAPASLSRYVHLNHDHDCHALDHALVVQQRGSPVRLPLVRDLHRRLICIRRHRGLIWEMAQHAVETAFNTVHLRSISVHLRPLSVYLSPLSVHLRPLSVHSPSIVRPSTLCSLSVRFRPLSVHSPSFDAVANSAPVLSVKAKTHPGQLPINYKEPVPASHLKITQKPL